MVGSRHREGRDEARHCEEQRDEARHCEERRDEARHCEERRDEAIQQSGGGVRPGLLRCARNDGGDGRNNDGGCAHDGAWRARDGETRCRPVVGEDQRWPWQSRISRRARRCRKVAAIGATSVATRAAMHVSGEVVVQIAPSGIHRLDQRELSPA
jgi:hypothetical protein